MSQSSILQTAECEKGVQFWAERRKLRLVHPMVDVVYRCAPDSVKVLERVQLPSSTPIIL